MSSSKLRSSVPGPIQGGMVHPYLARREGTEPVTYIDERLRPLSNARSAFLCFRNNS